MGYEPKIFWWRAYIYYDYSNIKFLADAHWRWIRSTSPTCLARNVDYPNMQGVR